MVRIIESPDNWKYEFIWDNVNIGNEENKRLLWISSYLNFCMDCKYLCIFINSFAHLEAVDEFQDLIFVFAYIWDLLLADFKLGC